MQRNKFIYALSDAGLVVNADFEKGGTWAGALEQLERFRFVPVFVRNGGNIGKGNQALLERGGLRWPEPRGGSELVEALDSVPRERWAGMKQEILTLREAAPSYEAEASGSASRMDSTGVKVEEAAEQQMSDTAPLTPAERLFAAVRDLLQGELKVEKTEAEIVELLGITKAQGKAWLKRLLADGVVEKVKKSKPVKYRAVERLL
jgi:predicted Rossmann fold nucleotide-binding protein DprA/Smf involved in DNA uptake